MRCGGVFGQALGQGDADRHFHIAGQALENFAHQFAFAVVQSGALDAVEGGDGEVDLLAAGARLRAHGELGQPAHVTHVVCGKPHVNPLCVLQEAAFCGHFRAFFNRAIINSRLSLLPWAGELVCLFAP